MPATPHTAMPPPPPPQGTPAPPNLPRPPPPPIVTPRVVPPAARTRPPKIFAVDVQTLTNVALNNIDQWTASIRNVRLQHAETQVESLSAQNSGMKDENTELKTDIQSLKSQLYDAGQRLEKHAELLEAAKKVANFREVSGSGDWKAFGEAVDGLALAVMDCETPRPEDEDGMPRRLLDSESDQHIASTPEAQQDA